MIKIHFLDGYKYIGENPDPNVEPDYENYRDNLTYSCFEITQWSKDKESFTFLFKNHVSWIDTDEVEPYLDHFIGNYVNNNKTPRLYLLVKQHNIETDGKIAFSVRKGKPPEHRKLIMLIEEKKQFYDNLEIERYTSPPRRFKAKKQTKGKQSD